MRYWPNKPPLGVPINWGDPLSRGIVGCWLMNEGGGNKIYDLSGNGNTGTFTGDVSWAAGIDGPSIDFPGTNDYIVTVNNKDFVGDIAVTGITVAAWVKRTATGGSLQGIIGTAQSVLHTYSTGGVYTEDGIPKFRLYANVAYRTVAASTALTVGRWYHVAGSYNPNGTLMSIYVDGRLINTASATAAPTWDPLYCTFGAESSNAVWDLTGQVSNGQVWARALTATEVRQLYMTPFRMFAEGF